MARFFKKLILLGISWYGPRGCLKSCLVFDVLWIGTTKQSREQKTNNGASCSRSAGETCYQVGNIRGSRLLPQFWCQRLFLHHLGDLKLMWKQDHFFWLMWTDFDRFQQSILSVFNRLVLKQAKSLTAEPQKFTPRQTFFPRSETLTTRDLIWTIAMHGFEVKYVARPKEGDVAYVACLWKGKAFVVVNHFFSWIFGVELWNNLEAFADGIWHEGMTGSVLCLASYDKTPPWTFISDYPLAQS